ncbi:hypothetical protein LOTGIDRAFT_169743 [Lottia gigantea]|uniref:Uncharacterized protein n=1 Tax=Lottia gigantea TaxID=225164 RepID=V3ZG31_LOTGI|nr:hypothetical protein LOTGIDRAFT_169743 [Lottia gigantea]ESO83102.1 hypothetical protein LOTGIDRAFT_169743 [Lottia gigantea]
MEVGTRITLDPPPIRDSSSVKGVERSAVRQILAYLTISDDQDFFQIGNKNREMPMEAATSSRWDLPSPDKKIKLDVGEHVTTLTAEELFRFVTSDHRYLKMDGNAGNCGDNGMNSVPNAAEIQKFFLETINRIAFQPIKDAETKHDVESEILEDDDEDDDDEDLSEASEGIIRDHRIESVKKGSRRASKDINKTPLSSTSITWKELEKRRQEKEIYSYECRAVQGKAEKNSLIKYASELLESSWKQYLSTPTEQLNHQNEKPEEQESGPTDDVIEMLEDRSRYVWQIIDEMPPRNLPLSF